MDNVNGNNISQINNQLNLTTLNLGSSVPQDVKNIITHCTKDPNKSISSDQTNKFELAHLIETCGTQYNLRECLNATNKVDRSRLIQSLPDETKIYLDKYFHNKNINSTLQLTPEITALINLSDNSLYNIRDYNDTSLLDSIKKNNYNALYVLLAKYLTDIKDPDLYEHVTNVLDTIIFHLPDCKKKILDDLTNKLGKFGNGNLIVKQNAEKLIKHLQNNHIIIPQTTYNSLSGLFNKLPLEHQNSVVKFSIIAETSSNIIRNMQSIFNVPNGFVLDPNTMTQNIQDSLLADFGEINMIDDLIKRCDDTKDTAAAEKLIKYFIAYKLKLLNKDNTNTIYINPNVIISDLNTKMQDMQNELKTNNLVLFDRLVLIEELMKAYVPNNNNNTFDMAAAQENIIKPLMKTHQQHTANIRDIYSRAYYQEVIDKTSTESNETLNNLSKQYPSFTFELTDNKQPPKKSRGETMLEKFKQTFRSNKNPYFLSLNLQAYRVQEILNVRATFESEEKRVSSKIKEILTVPLDPTVDNLDNLIKDSRNKHEEEAKKGINIAYLELLRQHHHQPFYRGAIRTPSSTHKEEQKKNQEARKEIIDFCDLKQIDTNLLSTLRQLPTDCYIFGLARNIISHPGLKDNDIDFQTTKDRYKEYIRTYNMNSASINIKKDADKQAQQQIDLKKTYLNIFEKIIEVYRSHYAPGQNNSADIDKKAIDRNVYNTRLVITE